MLQDKETRFNISVNFVKAITPASVNVVLIDDPKQLATLVE